MKVFAGFWGFVVVFYGVSLVFFPVGHDVPVNNYKGCYRGIFIEDLNRIYGESIYAKNPKSGITCLNFTGAEFLEFTYGFIEYLLYHIPLDKRSDTMLFVPFVASVILSFVYPFLWAKRRIAKKDTCSKITRKLFN
ncbi:hypothetical protein [Acanthopleuribacter pedis]|uniref:Uncharacterized protein n=1 Tax=Acanthopleuribacter pedis TaxID=442870 RepID=A0A8J7Q5H7_9BACT|nr:hypothetical protein [Acanthopleuribacter pedis]MBO1318331.1 hypothetical protein [Acanthopleuribacter pedis]